jgi:hypothetical protein
MKSSQTKKQYDMQPTNITLSLRQLFYRLPTSWRFNIDRVCHPPRHLNGQLGRERIVRDLMRQIRFDAVVETGTFRAGSTRFFASEFNLPVYSVERNEVFYDYAKLAMRPFASTTHLSLGDSRDFLRKLAADPNLTNKLMFFYLDAHWDDDLPLRAEVSIIRSAWEGAVVMIDDFQVPGDGGYAYDDYGPSKRLALSLLQPLNSLKVEVFFPRMPSSEETGGRRGCVVLADPKSAVHCNMQSLRHFTSA